MRDPLDVIAEICHDQPFDALEKIAQVLGFPALPQPSEPATRIMNAADKYWEASSAARYRVRAELEQVVRDALGVQGTPAAEPVAWLVTFPGEPELGHYLTEERPDSSLGVTPLYAHPPAGVTEAFVPGFCGMPGCSDCEKHKATVGVPACDPTQPKGGA